FSIAPLDSGYSYTGPSGVDDGNLCKCNTVTYSLISACDACQSETWITFRSTAQKLCLFQLSQTLFLPEHVCPNGLSLMSPFVAQFSSSTRTNSTSQLENNWNNNKSFAVGGGNLLPHSSFDRLIMLASQTPLN
ncbi:hypothetical protein BJV78DRAFT_1256868, partial [Lactifluus subvellereus]